MWQVSATTALTAATQPNLDYGNERECGQGVARAIKDGLVTRSDLFIVSKLWCTYHEKERVPQACKKSLEDWGLDYFDLYLVHFPVALKYVDFGVKYPPELEDEFGVPLPFGHATNQETWTAMEALVNPLGWARSIGVSNYNSQSIMDLLRYARIKPATLLIEHHPYLAQTRLLKYATDNKIQVTATAALGRRVLWSCISKWRRRVGRCSRMEASRRSRNGTGRMGRRI